MRKISNKQIYDALLTLKNVCIENECEECPLHLVDRGCCGVICGVTYCAPNAYTVIEPGEWKAFGNWELD